LLTVVAILKGMKNGIDNVVSPLIDKAGSFVSGVNQLRSTFAMLNSPSSLFSGASQQSLANPTDSAEFEAQRAHLA
jgi:hypothetical protein